MRYAYAVALLLIASTSYAQSVTMPAEVKIDPGRLAAVTITYEGESIKWDVPKELDVFREYDPDPTVIRLRLIGYKAGIFRLLAIAAKGGHMSEFATCYIVVGDVPGPVPPGPVPPGPIPPPPEPADPLFLPLKAAFRADAGVVQDAKILAAIYKNAGIVMDKVDTCGKLFVALNTAAGDATNGIPGKLLSVRRLLANDLNSRIKVGEATILTPELKRQYTEQFTRFATLLEALK